MVLYYPTVSEKRFYSINTTMLIRKTVLYYQKNGFRKTILQYV